ncbi:hypothetical protein [Paenibacillus sp. LHD-38]|uniref:hypothetical protein n=1 Tax=Paenibacillus sp. LHD-38 TaxID=3072143 RepID=UPI00280FE057|nr:hypothetical protein [Paenibacillus sp. LHD-38]MDQ8736218.1 hypothetical protein [Paenibacillus sp. LHD-38]
MTEWAALFKKDFRLTRTVFFIGLVINFLVLLLTLYVDMNTGDNLFLFIPLLVAVVLHIFYLPVILFISLRTEADQLHLWLHDPRSASTLLLSKVLNGIAMMFVSLVILYLMAGSLIISRFSLIEAYWTDTLKAGLLIFPHIFLISIMISAFVILLWSIHHALKYRIGRWTWLALLGAVIIPSWVGALIDSSKPYKLLTQWLSMETNFPTFAIDPIPLYAGEYLYHFMVVVGLFYLSAWIMDRKVEV